MGPQACLPFWTRKNNILAVNMSSIIYNEGARLEQNVTVPRFGACHDEQGSPAPNPLQRFDTAWRRAQYERYIPPRQRRYFKREIAAGALIPTQRWNCHLSRLRMLTSRPYNACRTRGGLGTAIYKRRAEETG